MKIKITKCSDTKKGSLEAWYADKLGDIFVTVDKTKGYHWVVYNNLKGVSCRGLVNKNDCEIIK